MTTDAPSAAWARYQETMTAPPSLGAAARANDLAELARLLAAGSPIDARDARGHAPVMLAAYAGHAEALELLLARGADPDTADLAGNTALMGAAFKGLVPIVRRLLDAGADPTRTNHAGLDARGVARQFGRHDVVAILEPHLPRPASPAQEIR
jgi:ankyrin repeat protein